MWVFAVVRRLPSFHIQTSALGSDLSPSVTDIDNIWEYLLHWVIIRSPRDHRITMIRNAKLSSRVEFLTWKSAQWKRVQKHCTLLWLLSYSFDSFYFPTITTILFRVPQSCTHQRKEIFGFSILYILLNLPFEHMVCS